MATERARVTTSRLSNRLLKNRSWRSFSSTSTARGCW
jgi:hypothetical protein